MVVQQNVLNNLGNTEATADSDTSLASTAFVHAAINAGIADGWISAAESWSYASATTITVPTDATTKYSPGMRIKLTQTTVKYFIITNVAATVLTVYGGTDYTLANAAISANNYSIVKAPFGFPLDPGKWGVAVTDTSDRSKTSGVVAGTWYNVGVTALSVPTGLWRLRWSGAFGGSGPAGSVAAAFVTLSSNASTETDIQLTAYVQYNAASIAIIVPAYREMPKTLTAGTWTLMWKSAVTSSYLYLNGASNNTIIEAICAYL